jgi:hypothetical protein
MRRVEAEVTKVRTQIRTTDTQAAPLIAAVEERDFWLNIIQDLNARLPKEHIWITELVATSNGVPVGGGASPRTGAAAPTPTPTPRPSPPGARGRPGTRPSPSPSGPQIDGIMVRGLYMFNPRQQEVVVEYFRNLIESPHFKIDPQNQAEVLRPSTPTNTEWAFPYEMRLELKQPISLPVTP